MLPIPIRLPRLTDVWTRMVATATTDIRPSAEGVAIVVVRRQRLLGVRDRSPAWRAAAVD
jgi:hypothetical protein